MRAQFRIVDLLWLILVSFFAVAWWVDHRRFVELKESLKPSEEAEMVQPPPAAAGPFGAAYGSYSGMPGMPGYRPMGGMGSGSMTEYGVEASYESMGSGASGYPGASAGAMGDGYGMDYATMGSGYGSEMTNGPSGRSGQSRTRAGRASAGGMMMESGAYGASGYGGAPGYEPEDAAPAGAAGSPPGAGYTTEAGAAGPAPAAGANATGDAAGP